MKCNMKSSFKSQLPFLLTVTFILVVQWPPLFEIPSGVHAWAQWDRYAIALGFLDNGFHLFHPQTFVYNHQFPSDWIQASSSTITAVDFPLHEWLVALIMKMIGNNSIIVLKFYIVAFSLIGLFFWWKTALTLTDNLFKSFVALVFASASPVFLFYAGSSLPSIPSLASAMAGIFFYVQFKKRHRLSDFYISIIWLTLAALTRTTFVIPLLSVFLVEISSQYKNHHLLKKFSPAVLLSVLTLAGYFFYNRFLFLSHGSMFLNELMPPKSWEQVKDCFQVIFENWTFEWFTGWHYFLFALIFVLSFFKNLKDGNMPNYSLANSLKKWSIFSLVGCLMFFIAMLRQFPHHDYYFLDTFFLPLCTMLLLILNKTNFDWNKQLIQVSISILIFIMVFKVSEVSNYRHNKLISERFHQMLENFSGTDEWLDNSGIPKNAKVLVVDVPAPNPPFILMKRKGYVVLTSNLHRPKHVEAALQFPFDFLVMEISRKDEIMSNIPQFNQHFSTVTSNNKLVLLKREPE